MLLHPGSVLGEDFPLGFTLDSHEVAVDGYEVVHDDAVAKLLRELVVVLRKHSVCMCLYDRIELCN